MTPTQDATLTDAQVDELERLLDDLFPGRTMKAEFRRIFPQAKLANRPAPNAEMIREIAAKWADEGWGGYTSCYDAMIEAINEALSKEIK